MLDHRKTKEQLINELTDLRRQVAALREDRAGPGVRIDPAEPWEVAWQSLVAHTPVFMLIIDDNCCVRFANHTDSGAKPDQLIGKSLCDFCQPEDRQSVRECVRRVFETAVPGYLEGSASRLDNEEHWYASHFGPIFQEGKVVAVSVVAVNINDRKQVERTLQESEERFRMAFEEGPIGVALVGLDAGIQHVNQRFCQMLGYSEDEIITLGISGITHPEDYARDHELGMSLLRGEIPSYTLENRYIRKDGQVIWVQLTTSMMHDASGKPSTVIGMIEDITQRKRAEEALCASEAKYRRLHESMIDAFVSVSMDGFILEYNDSYRKMLGYDAEELPKLRYTDITPEKWHDFEERIVQEQILPRGYSETYEKDYRKKDGTIFPVELRTFLIKDDQNKPCAMWAIVRDITERKRAEAALREIKEELQQVASSISDYLWSATADRNGKITYHYFSPVVGQITGRPPEFYMSGPDAWMSTIYSEDRPRLIEAAARITSSQSSYESAEYRVVLPDGTLRWVQGKTTARQLEDGNLWLFGTGSDIAERKRTEEALREAKDELEQRVEERTAELLKTNKELEIHRLFAQNATQGFGIADLNGRIEYLNAAMCGLLGEERIEDVVGQEFFKYGKSVDYLESDFLPKILRCGRWNEEGVVRTRQGRLVPIWQNSFIIQGEDGHPAHIATIFTDITERKAAEEAMRRSEARFRSYFEQGLLGMAISNIEMRWTEVNDRFCEIIGCSREEASQRKITDFIHPDDLESFHRSYRQLIAGETDHFTTDRRYILKNGEMINVNVFVRSFRAEDGTLEHVLALIDDVTHRHQAEAALRQNHDELQAIYEGMFDGFVITDLESKRFMKVNTSLCRILGYSESELLGLSIKDIHPPEDVSAILRRIKARFEGREQGHVNLSFMRKDGSIFFADIVASLITYEGRPCVAAFIHDVTEKRKAEAALRASEERYRAVVEDQTEIICRFDADGVFTFANEVFCRFFGKKSEELVGSDWHPVAMPEDVPMIEKQLSTMSPANPIVVIENRVYSGLGQVYWMQFVNRGFYSQDGRLIEIQSVGRDITERKLAQEALERERKTLKYLLQSSDHERQTIAYEIHDGLAQYLAGAIMQFDVNRSLRERKPTEAAKAYEAATKLLCQGHSEARRLIAGIRHPVLDEAGVVEAIAHLIKERNREKGPQIEFHSICQFDRLVSLLENAIYRIVQEAMTNACKYSQSDRVRITLLQQKDRLRIEIRDWGTGFDTKKVKEGSYGLTGIRERARLLGGKYRLRSMAGKGTQILVELPLLERQK